MGDIADAVMPDAGAETGDLQTAAAWDAYTQAGVSDSLAASAEAGAGIATDAALTEAVGLLEAAASDDALSVSEDPLATPDDCGAQATRSTTRTLTWRRWINRNPTRIPMSTTGPTTSSCRIPWRI
jgi:hypothetical protein